MRSIRCEQCKHFIIAKAGEGNIYGCDRSKCVFEPTTKNDLVDCIPRQSVLDKIQRLIDAEQNNINENGDYMNYARERVNAYEAIQFFVENDCLCPVNAYEAIQFFVENDCLCPSVTPIRPKGHWILADEQNKEDVENDNYRFICSECQCSDTHAKGIIVPYCWKCGADMRINEENDV